MAKLKDWDPTTTTDETPTEEWRVLSGSTNPGMEPWPTSVEKIPVGDLSDIREDGNSESRNWGASGNKKLHGWEFNQFTNLLEYKAEEHGIIVDRVDEENTSKTCSCCGQIRDANRVERGLYVCESCETTMNADVNGAVNIRRKITQSPPTGE